MVIKMEETCDEEDCDEKAVDKLRSDHAVCKVHLEEWNSIYDEPYET
jgi:hypothetical protein